MKTAMHNWEAILTDERCWPVARDASEAEVVSMLGPHVTRTRHGEWVLLEYCLDDTMWAFWWHRESLVVFEMHTHLRRDFEGNLPLWFQQVSSLRLTADLLTTSRDFALAPPAMQAPDVTTGAFYCAKNGGMCRIDCDEGRAWKYLFAPNQRQPT